MGNSLLKNFLDQQQVNMMVGAMCEMKYAKDSILCQEGTFGSHLYVISHGVCEVTVSVAADTVKTLGPGCAFGELAILYNCARTATVKAVTDVRVWVLDRKMFQAIMLKTGKDRRNQYDSFLRRYFETLPRNRIFNITYTIPLFFILSFLLKQI